MSSKGVATKVCCVFEPVRLWPPRTVQALSLEAFDDGLVGNTCVQLSFLLKTGGRGPLSRVDVDDDSADADEPLRALVSSVMIRGSKSLLQVTCGDPNEWQIELADCVSRLAAHGQRGFEQYGPSYKKKS
jgi:hypothetical protein